MPYVRKWDTGQNRWKFVWEEPSQPAETPQTPVVAQPQQPTPTIMPTEIKRAQRGIPKPESVPEWARGIDTNPPNWFTPQWGIGSTGAQAQQPFDYYAYMQRIAAGPSARERLIQQSLFAAEPFAYTGPTLAEALAGLQPLLAHPNVPKWSDYAPSGGGYYSSPIISYGGGASAKKGFSLGRYNWRIGI